MRRSRSTAASSTRIATTPATRSPRAPSPTWSNAASAKQPATERSSTSRRGLWTATATVVSDASDVMRRASDAIAERERGAPRRSAVALRRACRELEHHLRSPGSGEAPRTDVVYHLDDLVIPVEEDDVDRKEHEHRVNRTDRTKQQALVRVKTPPAEQSADPGPRPVCESAARADNRALLPLHADRKRCHGLTIAARAPASHQPKGLTRPNLRPFRCCPPRVTPTAQGNRVAAATERLKRKPRGEVSRMLEKLAHWT